MTRPTRPAPPCLRVQTCRARRPSSPSPLSSLPSPSSTCTASSARCPSRVSQRGRLVAHQGCGAVEGGRGAGRRNPPGARRAVRAPAWLPTRWALLHGFPGQLPRSAQHPSWCASPSSLPALTPPAPPPSTPPPLHPTPSTPSASQHWSDDGGGLLRQRPLRPHHHCGVGGPGHPPVAGGCAPGPLAGCWVLPSLLLLPSFSLGRVARMAGGAGLQATGRQARTVCFCAPPLPSLAFPTAPPPNLAPNPNPAAPAAPGHAARQATRRRWPR